MKKNVKYLGMAAAALLAVAPVVSSTAYAAGTTATGTTLKPQQPGTSTNTPANDGKTQATAIKVSQSYTEVNADDGVAMGNYLKPVSQASSIQFTGNVAVVSTSANANLYEGAVTAQTLNSASLVPAGESLKAGNLYTQVFTVALKGTAGLFYNINGTLRQANSEGIIEGVPVFVTIQPTNKNSKETPYYTMYNSNVVISDGAVANWTSVNYTTQTVTGVYDLATGVHSPVHLHNGVNLIDKAAIQKQLTDQGIKVAANGSFNVPANGFVITLKAQNLTSGKTRSVKLAFAGSNTATNSSAYPVISYNDGGFKKQAETVTGTVPLIQVKAGSSFNPTSAFTATVNSTANAGKLDMSVVSNPVNTNVPGLYNVTINATNPNGLTTKVSYQVVVTGTPATNGKATVKYVPGYGVNVWSLQGSNKNLPAFDGTTRLNDGTQVTTHEVKVVDGVSYTRITTNDLTGNNWWIQTKYLNGTWNESKPSTDNKGEEKISGVVEVVYNGRGGVKLLNGKGKYQTQVVKNGTAWKVFAKKTINGRVMYKLGNDNQWIPAQYVNFR